MASFEKVIDGVFLLKVPFENIYTSVFLLCGEQEVVLVDSAAYPGDAETYIIPALREVGVFPDILLCSHEHDDHSGGMGRLAREFPEARIGVSENYPGTFQVMNEVIRCKDGDMILNRFRLLNLKGHTVDSLGILDTRTNTLLSCDTLQLCGIGRFGTGLQNMKHYLETLSRVRKLRPENIVASHRYVPLGAYAWGKEQAAAYLDECELDVKRILDFTQAHPELSPAETADAFNAQHPELPLIAEGTIRSIQYL